MADGYHHDPRELVDIPEVRTLLRRLEGAWPYWVFFSQVDESIGVAPGQLAVACRLLDATEPTSEALARATHRAFGLGGRARRCLTSPDTRMMSSVS